MNWFASVTRSVIAIVVLTVFITSFIMANPSDGLLDGSIDIRTSPNHAYQDTPFDYHVIVTNSGSDAIHLTKIVVTIKWPGDGMFTNDQFKSPTEYHTIFEGDQIVNPGENHDFKGSITTGFWGGFPVIVSIDGRSENESSPSTRTYQTSISFESASRAPGARAIWFPILLPLFLGAFWIGYNLRKAYWNVEIANAMKNGNPGEMGYGKWWAYYWERDGKMWKNYLLWITLSGVMAAIIAFI